MVPALLDVKAASIGFGHSGSKLAEMTDEEIRKKRRKVLATPIGHELNKAAQVSLRAAWADNSHLNMDSTWKQWVVFCVCFLDVSPISPYSGGYPSAERCLFEDWVFQLFAECLLKRNLKVSSITTMLANVRSKHFMLTGRRWGTNAWGESPGQIKEVLKGLARLNPISRAKRIAIEEKFLKNYFKYLQLKSNHKHRANWALMLACWQGLLRKSEGAPKTQKQWREEVAKLRKLLTEHGTEWVHARLRVKILTRASITFVPDIENPLYAQILLGSTKNASPDDPGTETLLPYCPHVITNACAAIREMILADPLLEGEDPRFTPLFRYSANQPITTDILGRDVKMMMEYARRDGVWDGKGDAPPHALRIGGMNALVGANCPEMILKLCGRWASDAYQVYARSAHLQLLEWTSRMSTDYQPSFTVDMSMGALLQKKQGG